MVDPKHAFLGGWLGLNFVGHTGTAHVTVEFPGAGATSSCSIEYMTNQHGTSNPEQGVMIEVMGGNAVLDSRIHKEGEIKTTWNFTTSAGQVATGYRLTANGRGTLSGNLALFVLAISWNS